MLLPRPIEHNARQILQHTARTLRRVPVACVVLILIWSYVLLHGERWSFASAINSCSWEAWEDWPAGATPHHLVFIADPQLVDPHTYPGRPWPLDTLTEIYTDRYMSRSFRLINAELDPDSVVFLGDLFDGGREWAPSWGRSLSVDEKIYLYNLGVVVEPKVSAPGKSRVKEDDFNERLERLKERWQIEARRPGGSGGSQDIRGYVHGEEGRWKKWGNGQWATEMQRFSKIFYAPGQLYPRSSRSLSSTTESRPSAIAIDNGAEDSKKQAYSVLGHKQRKVVSNLPGNHDVGFGSGVQLSVRNRFQGFFGDGNDLYVLGNHTFLSLDSPSLSAYSEFTYTGETNEEEREKARFIWELTYQFLDNLQNLSKPVVGAALSEIFPSLPATTDPSFTSTAPAAKNIVKRQPAQAQLPVILLSHIPFYRDQGTDCGPLREKGKAIHVSAGYQYQNVLTKELTTHIVERVSHSIGDIAQVFSGDDHDYCDVEFPYDIDRGSRLWKSVRDITVKSFSWAMGVRKPGFLLVSLWNPIDENGKNIGEDAQTIQTKSCLLPDQLGIFIQYATLLVLTLFVLLIRTIFIALRGQLDEDASSSIFVSRSPPLGRTNSSSKANGFSAPSASSNSSKSHGRHRASSTSTSTSTTNPEKLSVQRSYTARTRSISPMPLGETFTHIASMAKNAISSQHLAPQVHWDLAEGHSDLESQIDESEDYDDDDRDGGGASGGLLSSGKGEKGSQAKWKRKPRRTGKVRRALAEFGRSLGWVAVPCAVLYAGLIWNG